jgi:hypothetical protein
LVEGAFRILDQKSGRLGQWASDKPRRARSLAGVDQLLGSLQGDRHEATYI